MEQADYHELQRIQLSGMLKLRKPTKRAEFCRIKLREEQLIPLQQAYDEAMRTYLNNSAVQLAALLKEHEPVLYVEVRRIPHSLKRRRRIRMLCS